MTDKGGYIYVNPLYNNTLSARNYETANDIKTKFID